MSTIGVKRPLLAFIAVVAAALIAMASGACNSQSGCPAKANLQPGAGCSDDKLQCAYDLATPSAACDGTSTTIASSRICTQGVWSCPSPYSCEAGADDGGGDDGAATDDSGDASPADATSDAPDGD